MIIYLRNILKNFKNHNFKDIEEYPNIVNQLNQYQKQLLNRREVLKGSINWFNLWWARDENFFKEGKKIIFTSRTKGKTFTYTEKSFYGTRNLFFIKSNRVNLKYITALLNSQLMYFYMQERLKHTGDLLQIDKNQFMKIPLYIPKDTKPFEILVDYIIFAKEENLSLEASLFESIIDGMVYDLYFEEEMKREDCFISDEVREVIKEFDNTIGGIKEMYKLLSENTLIVKGLSESVKVDIVSVIGESEI
jgi:adenine-specific DNA-methyltransferase